MAVVEDVVIDLFHLVKEVRRSVGIDADVFCEELAWPDVSSEVPLYEVSNLTIGLVEVVRVVDEWTTCLLYTSDAADE